VKIEFCTACTELNYSKTDSLPSKANWLPWLAMQDHHDLWSKRQQLDLSGLHRLEWLPA